jgi:hypothetical protein
VTLQSHREKDEMRDLTKASEIFSTPPPPDGLDMLHALGITHVVSVGECALVPPPEYKNPSCPPPRERRASLWIEEREGRIKVLDIQGIYDDGIDTLEPQLRPICDWIEKARLEGGQVLVHCRVGVSRSATVTVRLISLLRLPSPHGFPADRL